VSTEDMGIVLRQLAGSSLSDDELHSIISKVMRAAADPRRGLTFPEYKAALDGAGVELRVEVPVED
jgi:serine/threonine-protein phosphatase 2B regulatory subunit